MPPKKSKKDAEGKRVAGAASLSSHQAVEQSQESSPQMQDATQASIADPQNPRAVANITEAQESDQMTDDPKTPERTAGNDEDSPFRSLRQELGLSKVAAPALRPRRNSDPFTLRLRPDEVHNETNLQTAINELIYNDERVQIFMRLSLTPAEATAARDRQAAQVLSQFTDNSLSLRNALWYLEYADWDVELAILHQMHDWIDRNEAPSAESVQVQAEFPEENPKIDRDPARDGEAFDKAKFKVQYVQYGVARTKTYPEWQSLDRNNVDHVRALNSWRWKTIMAQVGLQKRTKRKGWSYNRLERRWARNYERDNPALTTRGMANAFNATFAGVMLPGEMAPRPTRSSAAIACLRLRAGEEEGGKVGRLGKDKDKDGKKRTASEAGLGSGAENGHGNENGDEVGGTLKAGAEKPAEEGEVTKEDEPKEQKKRED